MLTVLETYIINVFANIINLINNINISNDILCKYLIPM